MKYMPVFALFVLLVFHTACGQNQTNLSKVNTSLATKDISPSPVTDDPKIYSKYEYPDSTGKRLIIENGFPRGGSQYITPDGEAYGYAIFWTRIINGTDHPLELNIDFLDTYEVPSVPGEYFKLSVPPDTMTLDHLPLFNYGLTDLDAFLDDHIHKPSTLRRTVPPKGSSGFYVLKLSQRSKGTYGGGDILRTELILKGQDLFYTASLFNRQAPPSIISEKEIPCGKIDLTLK
ncbi:hypothetical protein [Flavilitoribacter nigricans]|uniref:Uncharacterized protein n=1 Tax=Flavilitoribacter nigricans (strain ATCC 23147 / DSM 23189 / NBRC 102662 / NCIMB 1420 / SS-2) TaxID=1122177 RepID=A0A2D0NEQ8_FLAN2|nr:hypothetical protein [Flavilitoribacter nigricans]PHN06982.1 hypothetical protein CRP01_08455 [Flavilitoribacter nigricans DSM 23189 = NBRC 102662]